VGHQRANSPNNKEDANMKTIEIKRFEEHRVLLIKGEDFKEKYIRRDELFPGLSGLPGDILMAIAKKNGFDKWTWAGCLKQHEDGEALTVKFIKYI